MTPGDLAILGGRPLLDRPLPVGQRHFPAWPRYVEAMRGIYEREWYTNHGPLAVEAERRLAAFLDVAHVVCVSSATVGLMMAVKALGLDGDVVVPALAGPHVAESLLLAGARPRFCDVAPTGGHATRDEVLAGLGGDVQAILGVNLWGDVGDLAGLNGAARAAGVPLLLDSSEAFGCELNGRGIGGAGAMTVFSFHQSNLLNAAEGGCVATDDEELAARLRNIRSSYGAGRPVPVPITSNGRFSEAQAALTLLGLEDVEATIARNRAQFEAYRAGLATIPGLSLHVPRREVAGNCQTAVVEVDPGAYGVSRDRLIEILRAENVEATRPIPRALHQIPAFGGDPDSAPQAVAMSARTVQLPLGGLLDVEQVEAIVGRLGTVRTQAAEVDATSR